MITDPTNTMASPRHDAVSIAFHWAIAVALVLTYAFGILREAAPRGPSRDLVTVLHTSIGVLVLAGALLRIGWRATRGSAGVDYSISWPAKLAHLALNLGMISVPLLGLMMVWAKGRGVSFFGLVELVPPFPSNRGFGKAMEELHEVSAHGLMVLIGLHAGAALFHHYVLNDSVLRRMMPRFR